MTDTNALKKKVLEIAFSGELTYYSNADANLQPKSIKQDEPFHIPETWKWKNLGDAGVWFSGATPKKSVIEYYQDGTIPWVLTGDLTDSYIEDIPNRITDLALKRTSVKLRPPGTILIAMYGATIGKLGILLSAATTNQACCGCETNNSVDNLYLFYYLLRWRDNFIKQGFGSGQPNISKEKIVKTPFPLPPLEEQKRIVTKIEELFAKIDEIDKAQKELKELAELAEKKVLSALINENEDFILKKIGCLITDIRYGSSEKTDYNNTGTPVLRIPNISNGTIDFNDLKKSKSILKESLLLKHNDILMIRSNGSRDIVGKAGLYSNEDSFYSFASFLIRIRPDTNVINANYLTLLLNSNYVREQMFSKSKSSSGINNINSKEIMAISIPVLPLSDQMHVIERYEAVSSILDSIR